MSKLETIQAFLLALSMAITAFALVEQRLVSAIQAGRNLFSQLLQIKKI
jgi:hypothetical protein